MRRTLVFALATLAAAACEPLPTGPALPVVPHPDLIAFYDQVAFGIGAPDSSSYPVVSRWADSTVISVQMEGGAYIDRTEADRIFADIEALTSLRFQWGTADTDSLIILIAPSSEWWCKPDSPKWGLHCPLVTQEAPLFPLHGALVYVLPDLEDDIRRCVLRHEIYHALGFHGHTDRTDSALLSAGCSVTAFSEEDRFAIETHYDPRVQHRMHRDSVHAALGWN